MKPVLAKTMHHIGQVLDEVAMGVDAKSIVHIMSILTDLYSDLILAIMREYSTNALDSHIDAGNPNPIEVTLPSLDKPTFMVQDYGLGMNVDDIRAIYSQYGASTKRDSDEVTGMLGLGSKSGLTYATSFTVDAVKNGVRTVALVTKTPEGAGVIKILDTVATDKPNGVCISIPVKSTDIHAFHSTAKDFYSVWEPGTVLVDGEEPELLRNLQDGPDTIWVTPNILIRRLAGYNIESKVVMGNVPYPIANPWAKLSGVGHNRPASWSNLQMVAWVPIGSVNFTPSREALMMSERTEATLKEVQDKLQAGLPLALNALIGKLPTPWDKLIAYYSWKINPGPGGHGIPGVGAIWSGNASVALPSDRVAYIYDIRGDKASKRETLWWADVAYDDRVIVVTNFVNRSLHKGARHRFERLGELDTIDTTKSPTRISVLVLPEGMDLTFLEGRKNVVSWATVSEKLDGPPTEKREKRAEVVYEFHKGGAYGTGQGSVVVPKGEPLVYVVRGDIPMIEPDVPTWRQRAGFRSARMISQRLPEATFVSITESQVGKFLRIHPHAVHWTDYLNKERIKAEKALTEADKMLVHQGDWLRSVRNLLRNGKILDPDVMAVLNGPTNTSSAVARCKALFHGIPHPDSNVKEVLNSRYPLLAAVGGAIGSERLRNDLVFYLNSKYTETNP